MKRNTWILFIIIIILAIAAAFVDLPSGPALKIDKLGINFKKEIKIKKGLDLQGGTHLAYEADMSKIPSADRANAIQGAADVIDRRINQLGVTEPLIQTTQAAGSWRVVVELPGIKDVNEAISLIGKTAQLEFKELKDGEWVSTGVTGAQFKRADVQIDQSSGKPEIAIQFNDEGKKSFGDLTERNLQKQVAIFLDDQLISAPTVQTAITEGKGVITGQFTLASARELAIQLNAGALPVPIKLVEQRNVGATLGQDSVRKSTVAGLLGLLVVALFMIILYRFSGILAVVALMIYTLLVLALFKLIPVTLTIAGIAGFILSIGMAVDANILIFERMKEELRRGKTFSSALEAGFTRAWSSVRDSNISSLITCFILFWFGTGSIRGFALTLALGILVSIFTAVTVTRTFLRILVNTRFTKNLWLFGISKKEIKIQ